ncbi:E3 SUMO-protein ligase RanBP2-like isoform X4 [Acropora palmata]|uniref:E3 SUMO-protein ligase RanBP2-like isoform X4 n=1 Tax=Acropora palmata TaxID=6131 RepID=UPI003DA1B317
MVWTKDDVDKYVIQVESNCKNARERNLKGYAFARLYREAADIENAKRYLDAYIAESEGDFRGHCLMGQLHELTGHLEKAVSSYRRSLELNNTQRDLVLKVVKLYCQVHVHPDRARAWADRAARLFPRHCDVFNLRLHLLESAEVMDYEAIEDLLCEEVGKRPRDVLLHIRLVRLYAVRGRLDDSFSHCVAVWKTKAFKRSLEWVTCCVEISEKYLASLEKVIRDEVIGSTHGILEVHSFLLIVLCQFVELQLGESNSRELINVLYRLDHTLQRAHQYNIRQSPRHSTLGGPTEWQVILTEMKAQLYLYCGTSLIWLAKEKFLTWPRGLRLACACYLASVSISEPETKMPWVARASKNKDPLKWYVMACSRLSRVGHFLMATRDRHGAAWMNNSHISCCSLQGLQEILSTIYRGEKDLTKSFLASDGDFSGIPMVIPTVDQLVAWDEVALSENPRCLQNIIWVGLHWFQLDKDMKPGVGIMVKDIFQELRPDVPIIEKHITSNMLCLRDIEAFVYAVVRTTAKKVLEDKDIFYEDYEPQVLPLPLCPSLSSPAQTEWWIAAYNLYTGKFSVIESGKINHTVQVGIEKIRAVGQAHGLQVQLLCYLGNTFGSKATYLKKNVKNPWYYEEHWKSLEKWSTHYLRKALTILEKLEKDENIPYCEKPLFPHLFDALMDDDDVKSNLESVRLALGGVLMKEGKMFDAMDMFEHVKSPAGMFNLAQVYKYLAYVEAQAANEDTDADNASPTKEYYQNLQEACSLLQAYLKMTNPADAGRNEVLKELTKIEALLQTGFPPAGSASGCHRDVLQHNYLETQSSTYASDVQDSDDNFWVEQPSDPNTKDFIATLSEVALNKGYFQEQMAIRDEAMSQRDQTLCSLREEVEMLKKQVNMLQSAHDSSLKTPSHSTSEVVDHSKPMFESTPLASKQAPLSKTSRPNIQGPLKIDPTFFAGLSSSNSQDKQVEELEETATSPTSPRRVRHDSSTSYTEEIYFEPLIPLPEEIEVLTGEEEEEMLFSSRAKLYRYDKEVAAWKDRGIGTMKILYNKDKGRSRILMRREVVHKICANHMITRDMKFEEKEGSANCLVWSTLADYSEEVVKPEQLAVKFKSQDEVLLFKKAIEQCQGKVSKGAKIQGSMEDTTGKGSDLLETSGRTSPLFGLSSQGFLTTRPTQSQPFVLPSFGVPAMNCASSQSAFTFGPPVTTESSFIPPAVDPFAHAAPPNASVFGGGSPEPNFAAAVSFGSFGSGTSPKFDLNVSNQSTCGTQTDPLKCDKCDSVSFSPIKDNPNQQSQSTGAFSSPVEHPEVSQQRLFWQQSSSLQSGKTESFQPLGDASAANISNFWQQVTSPIFQPPKTKQVTFAQLSQVFAPSSKGGKSHVLNANTDFSSSQLLLVLNAAKEQQDSVKQKSQSEGYDFSPYVVDEPSQSIAFDASDKASSSASVEDLETDDEGSEETSDDGSISLTETDGVDDDDALGTVMLASQRPPAASAQSRQIFSPSQANVKTAPVKTIPQHGTVSTRRFLVARSPLKGAKKQDEDCIIVYEVRASRADREKAMRLFLPPNYFNYTRREPSAGSISCGSASNQKAKAEKEENKQSKESTVARDETEVPKESACTVHVSGQSTNFDQLTFSSSFSQESTVTRDKTEVPKESTSAGHVFGQSASFGQLTFSSLGQNSVAFSQSKPKDVHKPFQGTGTQLFAGLNQKAEGQNDDELHFEPIIPLPEEIEVVTGEEGLDVLFSERAKLYRFDADTGQWKERGIGEMKLLRHPTSGMGRVLMRREQIKKLCANHNITSAMELKPNVGSDRSWVWYTAADYAEGGAKAENLAVKFKTAEGAKKFKEVFDEVKDPSSKKPIPNTAEIKDDKDTGCKLPDEFVSTFIAAPGPWVRDECFTPNHPEDLSCVARENSKSGTAIDKRPQQAKEMANVKTPVVESIEPITFQETSQGASSGAFVFQPSGSNKLSDSQLSTIGRTDPSEDFVEDDTGTSRKSTTPNKHGLTPPQKSTNKLSDSQLFTIGRTDPSEDFVEDDTGTSRKSTTPNKHGLTPPEKSTTPPQNTAMTSLLGNCTPSQFTFSLLASPRTLTGEAKSPGASHTSQVSPESPVRGEGDGPHFEPVIPLPEKVECRTGEEGEEVLFCERCKLFRYDGETSQWKERGIGDIKILRNASSGKYRVLMRREQIFKLCANHVISADMELKPFPNSDKSWLWTTFADFSEDVAGAETLAARFKTKEIASRFKETFNDAVQSVPSNANEAVSTSTDPLQKPWDGDVESSVVEDIAIVFEKHVSDDQKERAEKLVLPINFFVYEQEADTFRDEPELATSEQEQAAPDKPPEEKTASPSQVRFLFGSPTVASLSFQSVAASLGNSPFGKKSLVKSGFIGAGSQLFTPRQTEVGNDDIDGEDESQDEPHFEAVIPLPDKVEVKTGEENEEVMFSQRARLYRYDAEEKQWKERGVGDIKLLRNNVTGKMRVLMRREQVLKLCANHQITADMKLMPNEGSDRSWVWSTSADFSEQECKAERLAVRFKNKEIAQLFKVKFEECQQNLKDHASMNPPVQEETKEDKAEEEDLFAKFKAPEGSWECEMCFLRNESEKMKCVACSNPKPGYEKDQEGTSSGKPQFPFEFGATSSGSEVTFGSAAPPYCSRFTFGSIAPSSNLAEMPASVTSTITSGFTFGNMKASSDSEVVASPFRVTQKLDSVRVTFGSGGATVEAKSFNSNSETAFVNLKEEGNIPEARIQNDEEDTSKADECIGGEQPKAEKESPENKTGDDKREESEAAKERGPSNQYPEPGNEQKFLFGSPSVSSLSFQSVAASSSNNSPFGQKTTTQSQQGFEGAGSKLFVSQSSADGEYEEEDGPHFEPIISLPDKIEVKTGEENEEALFSQRAKLYRYVAEEKQWKERGVGDIKLLRNNVTGKMRVLMRREQVLKLCADHQITADMKLMPNEGSDRSWVWSTSADFTEEECKAERLAVKFKNKEIAQLFKVTFEECQQNLKDHASMNPPVQEETKEAEEEEDLFAELKASEGSWDCEVYCVRTESEKVKCMAYSNPKPGSEKDQDKTSSGKPLFGSSAPSSSTGFLFDSLLSGQGSSFGESMTDVSLNPAKTSDNNKQQSDNSTATQDTKSEEIADDQPSESCAQTRVEDKDSAELQESNEETLRKSVEDVEQQREVATDGNKRARTPFVVDKALFGPNVMTDFSFRSSTPPGSEFVFEPAVSPSSSKDTGTSVSKSATPSAPQPGALPFPALFTLRTGEGFTDGKETLSQFSRPSQDSPVTPSGLSSPPASSGVSLMESDEVTRSAEMNQSDTNNELRDEEHCDVDQKESVVQEDSAGSVRSGASDPSKEKE